MWGSNVPTHAIIIVALDTIADRESATVEGEVVITENLALALQQHRHFSKRICLWADQLCIDQQNIPERNAQVRIMNLIFENAQRVNCWLGLEPFGAKDGKAACKKLNDIIRYVEQSYPAAVSSSNMFIRQSSECIDIYDSAILGPYGDIVDRQKWEAIFVLFRNPWWRRAWIMPEVSRQKEPHIVFQGLTLSIRRMGQALRSVKFRLWKEVERDKCPAIYFNLLKQLTDALGQSESLGFLSSREIKTLQYPLRLMAILRVARASVATDPRDNVYAAIASMSNVEESSLLVPDYSSSIRIVYGRVVEYMVRTLKTLSIFATIDNTPVKLSADLPSWIPDWRVPGLIFPDSHELVHLYNASVDTRAQVCFDRHYVELRLASISVDTVHAVSTDHTDDLERTVLVALAKLSTIFREWFSMVTPTLGNLYRTGVPIHDAFRITMTMDSKMFPYSRGNRVPVSFMGGELDDLGEFLKDDSNRGLLLSARWHRFCVSQDGYMGLYPQDTQPGDKIFILLGSAMPAVLRPIEGGYKLIGLAYIHGLMDGEAMAGLESGQYQLEEITIL
ncbi:hypothetical protein MMC17_006478 [Xylographa soralifera]|nr:hypothetical protein [Xylographa soralifera]